MRKLIARWRDEDSAIKYWWWYDGVSLHRDCSIRPPPSRHRFIDPNLDGAILNFVVLSELGIPATSSFITYITSAFKLMVRLRWRDTAMMMPLETIVSTVVFQLSSTNSIFAIVPTQHRTTSSSHHRYRTIAPLLHRHHTSVIEFSRHRSIDPNLDGAIVNYLALSGFHTKRFHDFW